MLIRRPSGNVAAMSKSAKPREIIVIRPLVVGTLAALVLAAAPSGPAVAAAGELHGITCVRNGPITLTPGLTTTPRDFSYTERDVLDPCFGADGALLPLTGVLTVTGTAHGSCALIGDARSASTLAWSDGTSSVLHVEGFAVPPVATVNGSVASGRGAGTPVNTSALIAPPMDPPSECFTDQGLRHANTVGYLTFG